MITGFNIDIEHGGRVFHVQTEDKGRRNPVIESLIYSGGEIVTSRRSSYTDLAESADFSEAAVLSRMETQHQGLIQEITGGGFDADDEPMPFGHKIVSNRSLDEVALEYLHNHIELEQIEVLPLDQQLLLPGTRPTMRMKVLERSTERPICGASVTIRVVSTGAVPTELFSSATDEEGFIEACFEIPSLSEDDAAIICEAVVEGKSARYRQLVERSSPATSAEAP